MSGAVWVVTVGFERDPDAEFGPYTERQAHRVAEIIDGEAREWNGDDGVVRHPLGVMYARPRELVRWPHPAAGR